jgi:hypothetical protein
LATTQNRKQKEEENEKDNFFWRIKKMNEIKYSKGRRVGDPYIDRRSGENRRQVYDSDFWESGGTESRSAKERRQQKERRDSYVRVSEWSSVCIEDKADQ